MHETGNHRAVGRAYTGIAERSPFCPALAHRQTFPRAGHETQRSLRDPTKPSNDNAPRDGYILWARSSDSAHRSGAPVPDRTEQPVLAQFDPKQVELIIDGRTNQRAVEMAAVNKRVHLGRADRNYVQRGFWRSLGKLLDHALDECDRVIIGQTYSKVSPCLPRVESLMTVDGGPDRCEVPAISLASSMARGVGRIEPPSREKSSYLKRCLSFLSEWLIADCVLPRRTAAFVTLVSRMSTSKTRSRVQVNMISVHIQANNFLKTT